jgi:hypothetical protein
MLGLNSIEEVKEFEGLIDSYPDSEILDLGKKYLKTEDYERAIIVFSRSLKNSHSSKNISRLYGTLVSSILANSPPFSKLLQERLLIRQGNIVDKVVGCMIESTQMYSEGELSKEDLLNVKMLVDKVPFRKMTIPNRAEFEMLYNKFKSYTLDVYLSKK